jgi:cytosine/adenosine deaminase-related metal-dependent hydrolase
MAKKRNLEPTATLYTNATIITVNQNREIILDGAMLVEGSRISAIGKAATLAKAAENNSRSKTTVVDLKGGIVLPGLINTHAHLAQSLLRGLAEDLNLHSWLCDAIWPLEAAFDGEDGYVAAKLTIAEMLLSGTTCFLESMLTHLAGFENVARAVEETGIRACLGKLVKPVETRAAVGMVDARDKDVDAMSVDAAYESFDRFDGSCDGRLGVWMALGTPRGNDAAFHRQAAKQAKEKGMGVTMHCAEAPKDLEIYRDSYQCSPAEFCQSNGIVGSKTVLAHMVNVDLGKDLPILAKTGTSVAHNPSSNCKLGSGIAAIQEMLAGGVNVALGTDGAPCANTYDMVREMDMASKLQAGKKKQVGALPATTVLEMATINAAKSLGLEHETGSLEVNKKADFIIINPNSLASACAPWSADDAANGGVDPITAVVHSCTGRDVELVVVDGNILVQCGKLVRIEERALLVEARKAARGIRERSSVRAQHRPWPIL